MLIWAIVIASAAWVGFAYVGYPLVLMALARFSPRPVRQEAISPPISIIITVHNGAVELPSKLEATLALDYLGEKEVIVSSDGSTDETEAIVKAFEDRGVRLVSSSERGGKEAGQARVHSQSPFSQLPQHQSSVTEVLATFGTSSSDSLPSVP